MHSLDFGGLWDTAEVLLDVQRVRVVLLKDHDQVVQHGDVPVESQEDMTCKQCLTIAIEVLLCYCADISTGINRQRRRCPWDVKKDFDGRALSLFQATSSFMTCIIAAHTNPMSLDCLQKSLHTGKG